MRTKLRKTDSMFAQYIKKRDDYACQCCRKKAQPRGLHCSHYWGRGHESTRFDPDNCVALCFWCHLRWGHGEGRSEYMTFMIARLGQERYDALSVKAHTIKKRNDKADEIYIKELLNG